MSFRSRDIGLQTISLPAVGNESPAAGRFGDRIGANLFSSLAHFQTLQLVRL
jgi:hypothetical protein